jgi:hypothetical protein
MKGTFQRQKLDVITETPRLEAQPDMDWERVNFLPQRDAPQPERPPAGEVHLKIFQPPQSFTMRLKDKNHVFFLIDKNTGPTLIRDMLGTPADQPVAVWKVPYHAWKMEEDRPPTDDETAAYTDRMEVPPDIIHEEKFLLWPEPRPETEIRNDVLETDNRLAGVEIPYVFSHLYDKNFKPDTRYVSKKTHLRFNKQINHEDVEIFYAVGSEYMSEKLNKAQQLDFDFAQNIQGLQGCTQDVVWTSVNHDKIDNDRSMLMEKFLGTFVQKFLMNYPASQNNNPQNVISEAIRMYEKMTQRWNLAHVKGVSPRLQAHCEALLTQFKHLLGSLFKIGVSISQLAFYYRRNPKTAKTFGLCLHYFMIKLEQDRGTRNANYKSMNNAYTQNIFAMKMLENMIHDTMHETLLWFKDALQDQVMSYFEPYIMDWFDIATQFSFHYPEFKGWRHHVLAQWNDGVGGAAAMHPFVPFV